MWPLSAIRKWRWKNATITLTLAFSLMASGKAVAKISPRTRAVEVEIQQISRKIEKNQLLTEQEEREFPDKIVKLIKLLTVDIIADLKAGNLEDAAKEYRKMITALEALTFVGKKSHVHKVNKSFAAVEAEIKALLKDKDKDEKHTLSQLPSGEWIFVSKNFLLYIKVIVKEGKEVVLFERGGFPLEKGEWQKASKGKPEELKDYVIKEILKVKDPKILE